MKNIDLFYILSYIRFFPNITEKTLDELELSEHQQSLDDSKRFREELYALIRRAYRQGYVHGYTNAINKEKKNELLFNIY